MSPQDRMTVHEVTGAILGTSLEPGARVFSYQYNCGGSVLELCGGTHVHVDIDGVGGRCVSLETVSLE